MNKPIYAYSREDVRLGDAIDNEGIPCVVTGWAYPREDNGGRLWLRDECGKDYSIIPALFGIEWVLDVPASVTEERIAFLESLKETRLPYSHTNYISYLKDHFQISESDAWDVLNYWFESIRAKAKKEYPLYY